MVLIKSIGSVLICNGVEQEAAPTPAVVPDNAENANGQVTEPWDMHSGAAVSFLMVSP
jgi:hypothetical protein